MRGATSGGSPRILAPGVIEPRGRELRLATDDAGRVAELSEPEDPSALLPEGTLLASLSREREEAALDGARAALREARARLTQAQRGRSVQEIAAAAAEAREALAASEVARQSLERGARLHQSGAISGAQMERATGEAAGAVSALEAREAQHRALVLGRRSELVIAHAQVDAAEAALAAAEAALRRRQIHAPYPGRILELRYRVGEYYDPETGGPLLLFGDTERLWVRAELDARDLERVHLRQGVMVRPEGSRRRCYRGHVSELGRRLRPRASEGAGSGWEPGLGGLHSQVRELVIELDEIGVGAAPLPGQSVLCELDTPGSQPSRCEDSSSD